MSYSQRAPTRAVVISDLHLGGSERPMMSRPKLLASFIDGLPQRRLSSGELELIIAGDFVDFLALQPHASWTPKPDEACAKLEQVVNMAPFADVFDALGRHLAGGHRLTVILGNHDVELALPAVQAGLMARLEASAHSIHFVGDGRAYRIGGALVEHGNRYDDANVNDYTNLRAIASAQTRGESARHPIKVSAGSELVCRVVNQLKPKYPFVDLLQPTNEVVALLLLALEPSLRWQWRMILRTLYGAYREHRNALGRQPGATTHVSSDFDSAKDPELSALFGSFYNDLFDRENEPVAASDWLPFVFSQEGIASLIAESKGIPSVRIAQIRATLRRMLLSDESGDLDGPSGSCGEAAKRMIQNDSAELVVMGHTHLARRIDVVGHGRYINTGTWVDCFRVPPALLEEGSEDRAWIEFLRDLCEDRRILRPPTYAEFEVDIDGRVQSSDLHMFNG